MKFQNVMTAKPSDSLLWLLPMDVDIKLSAVAPGPWLSASHYNIINDYEVTNPPKLWTSTQMFSFIRAALVIVSLHRTRKANKAWSYQDVVL